jgi:hypothetical protein
MNATRRRLALAQALALALLLGGCGGDPVRTGTNCAQNPAAPDCPPPPPPSATITAAGDGSLILHPSLNPTYAFAMEAPFRLTETSGGSADWNFVRMALLRSGVELERVELGADTIRAAGFGNITARSSATYTLLCRFNSSDFDQIDFTLGFGDKKDGRQFTVPLSLGSFQNVGVNPIPLSVRWSQVAR